MKHKKCIKSDFYKSLVLTISVSAIILLIINQEAVTKNCKSAIYICINTIIPVLLPIQILSYFLLHIGLPLTIKEKSNKPLLYLFGMSGNSAIGLLLAMCGGYNAAIKTAIALYDQKEITLQEAVKLSILFSNPGISFCILIFGIEVNKSLISGLTVFIVSNLVSCIIAFIANRFKPQLSVVEIIKNTKDCPLSDSLVSAVNKAGRTVILICLWILAFSVIKSLFGCIISNPSFTRIFEVFSDITTGIFTARQNYSLAFSIFALMSGGLCILLQQLEDIRLLKIKISELLFIKIINSAITTTISAAILKLPVFCDSVTTFSHKIKPLSGTPISALSVLLLLFVFFSLLYERKTVNIQSNDIAL